MKICKRCKIEKSLDDFYRHSEMGDGHLNICILCKRMESKKRRDENIEEHRKKDRVRFSNGQNKEGRKKSLQKWRKNNPKKYKAQCIVNSSLKKGLIKKEPCEKCGSRLVHAHHDDYSKPLDVRWLCPVHHSEHHKSS